MNLLNHFDGSLGTKMRKATHLLGGVGSSNPRCWRWKGERFHDHGGGVW